MGFSGPQQATASSVTSQRNIVSHAYASCLRPTVTSSISLFIRLVGIKEARLDNAMDVDLEAGDNEYPPTFNIQSEVVRFTVSDIDNVIAVSTDHS